MRFRPSKTSSVALFASNSWMFMISLGRSERKKRGDRNAGHLRARANRRPTRGRKGVDDQLILAVGVDTRRLLGCRGLVRAFGTENPPVGQDRHDLIGDLLGLLLPEPRSELGLHPFPRLGLGEPGVLLLLAHQESSGRGQDPGKDGELEKESKRTSLLGTHGSPPAANATAEPLMKFSRRYTAAFPGG